MVALKRQVRVGESKLRDDQVHGLRNLREVADAELSDRLLYLGIIGIRRAELKRAGLLEEHDVLNAHRGFARVIDARRQLRARITGIRPRHPRGQRGSRLWSKRIRILLL